ncbi:MAG: DUF3127 domain-containing protein [Bacteroidales bacterium]|jgi:hypothetical protein|nr:DUF3127 domain-containing protein [Bacteroidales bacterium]
MALEITGKLIQKLEPQSGIGTSSGKSWQKQDFVIETLEDFPRKICMNVWGEKLDMLANLSVGDTVVVSFRLESREFNGRWYTDVRAWKIEKQGAVPPGMQSAYPQQAAPYPYPPQPYGMPGQPYAPPANPYAGQPYPTPAPPMPSYPGQDVPPLTGSNVPANYGNDNYGAPTGPEDDLPF